MTRVHRIALGYLIIVWVGAASAWFGSGCSSAPVTEAPEAGTSGEPETVAVVPAVEETEGTAPDTKPIAAQDLVLAFHDRTLGERIGAIERAGMSPSWLAEFHTKVRTETYPSDMIETLPKDTFDRLARAIDEMADRSAEQRKLAARWRYGCQLARTAVSENTRVLREPENGGTGGKFTSDIGLIHQVATNSRPSENKEAGSPLPGLAAHAGHVNLLKLPKPGNRRQPWTRALPCEGDSMPDRWVDVSHVKNPRSDDNPKGDRFDGDWRTHGPHWVKFRDRVIKLALKGRLPKPCKCRVQRWGNWEDVCADRNTGFCICDCGDDAANYGLAKVGQGCELTLESNPAALCVAERRRRGQPIGATLSAKEAAGW